MPKKTPVPDAVDKRIAQYIAIRDKLKEMKEKFEADCKDLLELQEVLSGWLSEFLEKSGGTSIKTSEGTAYISTRYTASLADPEAFMNYVVDKQLFDLLDRRANATAVKDYVEEHGNLPPGVNLNAMQTVGVRRA